MKSMSLALAACMFLFLSTACGNDSTKDVEDGPCEPTDCSQASAQCGEVEDGCGNILNCGRCEGEDVCVDGSCVADCQPTSCEDAGASCGEIADGCGGTIACGSCEGGDVCVDGSCVADCQPMSCEDTGSSCGEIADGCGETIACGSCEGDDVCVDGSCVADCQPVSCEDAGVSCGPLDDGCGGVLDCNGCLAPESCGGAGDPAACGCTPQTDSELCLGAAASCGSLDVVDSCGNARTVSDCGSCEAGATCSDSGSCLIALGDDWQWGWPQPTGSSLAAVWSFADDDTWAVGSHGTIVHWNGSSLDLIPSGTTEDLHAIWASGPDDLWAVGNDGTVLHHDGSAWSFRSAPGGAPLMAVAGTGPSDVWLLPGGSNQTSLIHCDATSCSETPSPLGTVRPSALASSQTQGVWAVGENGAAASWDGQGWTQRQAGAFTDPLEAVAVGPAAVWASAGHQVVRWSAAGWVEEAIPWQTWSRPIHLFAAASGDLWALAPEGAAGHALYRLEAGAWSKMDAGMQTGHAAHRGAGSLWIAGGRGQLASLEGATALPVTTPPLYCQDFAATPRDQNVQWARCGIDVLRIEDGAVELLPRPEGLLRNETGRGIWSQSPDEVWLVSGRSRIHRWDGTSWQTFTQFGGKTLNAMAGSGDVIWVFGEKGLAWRWLGDGFSEMIQTPAQYNLLSAWAASPDRIWAAGGDSAGNGVILSWNGSSWQVSHHRKLNSIHGHSATDVWAVGDDGFALRWNGQSWSEVATGTRAMLRGVRAHSGQDVFVLPVGEDDPVLAGRLLHWNGSVWQPGPRPLHSSQAIATTPDGRLVSAGDGILFLR